MRHTASLFAPWRVQESYLAVDVFFVLSGVVISQAYAEKLCSGRLSFKQFAWMRTVRIMPLYLAGTAISVVAILAGLETHLSYGMLAYYAIIGMLMLPNPGIGTFDVYPLNNPAWSLPLELIVNAFYARFIRYLTLVPIAIIMALSAAGIFFTVHTAKSHSLNIGFWIRSFPFGFFRVGYSFFAGVLLFRFYSSLKRATNITLSNTLLAWAVLGLTAAVLTAAPSPAIQPYYDVVSVILVFPAIVFLGLLFQPSGISARAFRFLGLISYAVYTLHAPLAGALGGAIGHRMMKAAPASGVAFLILLIPLCWFADKLFDFPVRRWLLAHTPRRLLTLPAAPAPPQPQPA
jgi:peptidoglycan/LPS O-acetylase OafA/YrhL